MSNYDPAFPTTRANYDGMEPAGEGMTLRDYFAAKALKSILLSPVSQMAKNEHQARWAYEMADAMLKAREA